MKIKTRVGVVATSFVACVALAHNTQAQFIKADNTTSLNLASSYTSNSTVPTAADTIIFDNTLTIASRTANLGGNLSILGISATATPVSGATRQWQIGPTANATLTIGSGGITKASNTSALILNSAVALGANQTWTLNSGTGAGVGNLQVNGAFSDGGNTLMVTGTGIFDLRGSNTFGPNVIIDTTVSVNAPAATVVLGGLNTFNVVTVSAGRLEGATIGNYGVASNFGDGGTNSTITVGGNTFNGTMVYTGNTTSTNRTVTRDARTVGSGIEVTTAGQTLTITGNLSSGTQVNEGNDGWVFGGAGNLISTGVISNSTGGGSTGTTLTKNGAGTLTVGGVSANTYSGNTTITNGTLVAATDKSLGNTAGVFVSGGVLDIRGVTAGTVTLGAGGNFSLSSGSIKLQLGTIFDQIVSSGVGAFSISGGNFELDVTGLGFSYGNTYAVLTGFGGANSVEGLSFSGFDTTNYTASMGTDGVLSFTAVPEPSMVILFAVGMALVLILRRRSSAV